MSFSRISATGDGVTKDFSVTFDYLDPAHVTVRVNKVFTDEIGALYKFAFINPTTVRVDTVAASLPPAGGDLIEIIRQTPIDTPAVVFGSGPALTSDALNKNSEYLTYALQEVTDANDEFTKLYLGAFASPPTTDNDGAPLQIGAVYYNTTSVALFYWTGSIWIIGESTIAATAARDAAQVAQAAAEVAQAAAAASQSAASGSAIAAAASAAAASASKIVAAASEVAAAASAAAALVSKNAAEAAEVTASAAAVSAAANAGTATTQAGIASAAASAASADAASADADAISAAASAAAAIEVRKIYQGALAAAPTVRTLDGSPLQPGDYYLNTVTNLLRYVQSIGPIVWATASPTTFASQAEAEAGVNTTNFMNPLRTAQAIAALAASFAPQVLGEVSLTGTGAVGFTGLDGTKGLFFNGQWNTTASPALQVSLSADNGSTWGAWKSISVNFTVSSVGLITGTIDLETGAYYSAQLDIEKNSPTPTAPTSNGTFTLPAGAVNAVQFRLSGTGFATIYVLAISGV